MNQFLTTIGKLAMDSDSDSASGDVFIAQPKTDLKHKLGTIVGIIELFAQPDDFADKFFEIIGDLETEFYLPPFDNDGGIEQRFEECLQRANRRIGKAIADSIIEIELKNINAMVALINKNNIYISQIGQNNAFLFHRKKRHDYAIIDIFSQAGEKPGKINQDKMFSNIINGEMTEKDNLLFCNDTILEYLSQNELMEIVTDSSLSSSIKEIQNILEEHSEDNDFYAIAINPATREVDGAPIVENESEEDEDTTPIKRVPSQNSINKLISTQENTEKYLAPSMVPNWKKALILIYIGLKKSLFFLLKYIKVGAIKLAELTKVGATYGKNRIGEKTQKTKTNQPEEEVMEEDIKEEEEEIEEEPQKEIYTHQKYKEGQGLSQNISNWLNNQIEKFVGLNKIQQTLLILAVILLFFFSQSMVWQGRTALMSDKTSTSDKISQIEEYLNTGEAQNIFNDESGAKESLTLATSLMEEIPDSRKYKGDKESLQQRIDELTGSLQKISYVDNPQVISDLSNQNSEANIVSIYKFGDLIFAFDNQNQNIYKVDLINKQTISRQLSSNFNDVKKIVAIDENNVIILNGSKELYKYNFEDNTAQNTLMASDTVSDFDIYGGKLYSLRPEENQIYKHFPVENGYNSGSAWLKDGASAEGITSIAIDGGIYAVSDNGDISYFMAGKEEVVSFSPTNPPLSSPKQMFSEIESNYLYILDQNNNRVVVLDKNSGSLKTQYTSKEFSDIKSITVEEKEKNIYILSNNKIYLIEINF